MRATLEKIEQGEAYVDMVITAADLEKGLERAYQKNAGKYKLPGFRKGAVPRKLVEAKFGWEILLEDALEVIVPRQYQAAVMQLKLAAAGQPDIEVGYVEKGKPVQVKVRVPLKPEITLGRLEGLTIKLPKTAAVTERAVEQYLQNLRARNKQVLDKADEPAAPEDTVTIDYECLVQGAGRRETEQNVKVTLGLGNFFPEIENQLVGTKKGDKLTVALDFPQEHSVAQLAGKQAVFQVTVNKVEKIQLRELDDQFAQEVANLHSLEELRAAGRQQLLEMAARKAEKAKKQAVITALLANTPFAVSELLVMPRAKAMLEEFSEKVQAEGGSMELYLQMIHSTAAAFKQQVWEDAVAVTKSNYLLEKIIEEKDFSISEAELSCGIENLAVSMGMEKENARQNLGPLVDKVLFDLKANKAIEYLLDHAVIADEDALSA